METKKDLHLKIYLPSELYLDEFPMDCTFSDVREVIKSQELEHEEYSFLIDDIVLSKKNESKQVRLLIKITAFEGHSEAVLKTKINEKGTGLEYQLQITLPSKQEYWLKYKKSDKLSVAQLRK